MFRPSWLCRKLASTQLHMEQGRSGTAWRGRTWPATSLAAVRRRWRGAGGQRPETTRKTVGGGGHRGAGRGAGLQHALVGYRAEGAARAGRRRPRATDLLEREMRAERGSSTEMRDSTGRELPRGERGRASCWRATPPSTRLRGSGASGQRGVGANGSQGDAGNECGRAAPRRR
jgi:hypothetical protein